jgi:hypothetical protein
MGWSGLRAKGNRGYNHRMIPQKMLDMGYSFACPDFEPAVRDLIDHQTSGVAG